MKKVIVAAIILLSSLTAAFAVGFTDQTQIQQSYCEDVEILVKLELLGGYPDGTFRPQGELTRAEFTKLIYLVNGGQGAKQSAGGFTDVPQGMWAKKYIDDCAKRGIVGGVGHGRFNPQGKVTVAEASKMLLVSLGCDAEQEGFGGEGWQQRVRKHAKELGILTGLSGSITSPATREVAAKLVRNALFANMQGGTQTLAEHGMGLMRKTGIAVSNERYAITRDEKGALITPAPTVQKDGNAQLLVNGKLQIISTSLSDRMLGTLVDAYEKNGKILTCIYNRKTVVFDVTTGDVKIMPDGSGKSNEKVAPYIAIQTDTGEKRIYPRANIAVPQNWAYSGEAFAEFMYFAQSTPQELVKGTLTQPSFQNGKLDENPAAIMVQDMKGVDSIQPFRVVSVDGGRTFSYVFRFSNIVIRRVNSINNKEIDIDSIGKYEYNKALFKTNEKIYEREEIAAYIEDGILAIEGLKTVYGRREYIENNVISVGNTTYRGDTKLLGMTLEEVHMSENKNAYNSLWRSFGGYIVNISYGVLDDTWFKAPFVVITASSYDQELKTAKVRMVDLEGVEGVYELSQDNEMNLEEFADNNKVGCIYRGIIQKGKALFKEQDEKLDSIQGIRDGQFMLKDGSKAGNENSFAFLMFGNERTEKQTLKVLPYMINNIEKVDVKAVAVENEKGEWKKETIGTLMNFGDTVCGAISIYYDGITFKKHSPYVAYLLDVKQRYNFGTNRWYLEVKMLGDDGLIEARTTEQLSGISFGEQEGEAPETYGRGCIVRYMMDKDGILNSFDNYLGKISDMSVTLDTSKRIQNGFYYVNVAEIRGSLLYFYPYGKEVQLINGALPKAKDTMTLDRDYDVIAIRNDEFVQKGEVETVPENQAIGTTDKNAIIMVSSEKIIRVYSLYK